jgi:type IV secretion system protein VirB9
MWFLGRIFIAFFTVLFFANKISATQSYDTSIPISTDTRMQFLIYNPYIVYEIPTVLNYITTLVFSQDETTAAILIGDGTSWNIVPRNNTVVLQVTQPNVDTNMVVETNKRTYHFKVSSYSSYDDVDTIPAYVYMFFYPDDNVDSFQDFKKFLLEQSKTDKTDSSSLFTPIVPSNDGGGTKNLYYKYSVDENEESLVGIFDDGKNTYLKFDDMSSLPEIFDYSSEKRVSVSTKVSNGYVVVDGIHNKILLRRKGRDSFVYRD